MIFWTASNQAEIYNVKEETHKAENFQHWLAVFYVVYPMYSEICFLFQTFTHKNYPRLTSTVNLGFFLAVFSQTPAFCFCALLQFACWGISCAGSALCRARAAFGNGALRGARQGARSRFGTCWGVRRHWSYIAVCAAAGHQDKRECQNGGKNDWNDLFHVDMLLLPVFFRKYAGFMALIAAVNNAADRPGNHQDSQISIPGL